MPVFVRPCSYADVETAPEFDALIEAYGMESSIDKGWRATPQGDTYRGLEAAGVLQVFGAYWGEALVGFASVLTTVLPHFGRPVAVSESFFVEPAARPTGAGMMLLHAMETYAEQHADGLLISAPIASSLDQVLNGLSAYRATNRVHFRRFR